MATWTKVVVESSAGNIAQKAATSGTADNITSQGQLATLDTVNTGNINSNAITTAKINNSAITNAKIADNAVSEAKLYAQNSASNGQVLSFSGSDAFTWVDQTSQVSVDAGLSSSSSNPVENHAVFDALALKEATISSSNRVDATNVGTGVVSNAEFNYLNGVNSAIQTQLGAKVGTSGDETITGNKTFSGNTTVANLTVTGNTTTVNTEEINLADNAIVFNSNHDANTAPSQDSGITVNRGSSTDQSFYWDESTDKWSIGHTESGEEFTSTANVAMIRTGSYVSSQTLLNGFGAVGSFQLTGTSLYVRTA